MTGWCKTVGQPCPYSCHEGYKEHDLVSWLKCSTSGQWVPWLQSHFYDANFSVEDLCTPKPCPTTVSKGTLSTDCKAVVGSICNFSCEVGYVRNISVSELTCQTSTEWSPDLRSLCLRPDGLQCPYAVPKGYLNLACIREPGYTCNFVCNKGYQSSISPSKITCGSNLKWNYDLGSLCKGNRLCPDKVHGGYINWKCNRIPQESCTYDCYQGYLKNSSITWLTCQENGLWDVDANSLCTESEAIYSLKATTSTVPRNDLSIVGIAVGGCIIGTILVTVCVVLIIQRSSLRTSHGRRLFGHVSSRCMQPTGQYDTSIVQNHNTNITGVAAPNEPYVHSFDSRIDIISSKYSGLPPSYSQIQVTSKEYPPTYEQVVANPTRFFL
ncbi:hypothetical protein CHS0354_002977 [Potamilus streckersoni]|nr:hypothetical protein CHS0354_002977 [Potamilus streckersoni]